MVSFPIPILALSALASLLTAQDLKLGETQFQTHCTACHQPDHMLVGPSMVEIAAIYQKDQAGFIKWCLEPGKRRPNAVEMPAMAHVGEDNLKAIHAYLLDTTKGKKEKPVPKGKRHDFFPSIAQRPIVQRFFMPDSSPASIAVALPGGDDDLNFCYDTAQCRLRYVWKNKNFMAAWPYWQSNGNAKANLQGEVIYREEKFPIALPNTEQEAKPKFLGYTLDPSGIPTFRYQLSGNTITERIVVNPDGDGLERTFASDSPLEFELLRSEKNAVQLTGPGELIIDLKW
ncbi:MAG: c-type cytochrome [Roseibacillus sp.]